MTDANPWLARDTGGTKGGAVSLERPGEVRNVAWQTRAAPPTEAENRLADALQAIFAAGVDDLPGIVAHLNAAGPRAPDDSAWTEASLTAALARLARA
jgi:hypothetical protein